MPAITLATNFGGGTTPTAPATYTQAGRPAASSMPHEVIYVSDLAGGRHQVSDGSTWLMLNVENQKAPRACTAYTLAARPVASAAGAGAFALITDLAGGTYQRSDGTNWASLGTDILTAHRTLLGVRTDRGVARPTPVTRRTPASVVYIHPVTGNNANPGTVYTAPRQSLPGTLTAGTMYLFADGTTVGGFTVGQNGTSTNPIVIGVYNPTNGARLTDRSVGRVTVTGQINIINRAWVSLEHLNVTAGDPRIAFDGTTSCQIICCRANGNSSSWGMRGFWSAGNTGAIEIDGCEANGNREGIVIDGDGGDTITGFRVQLCTARDNLGPGIRIGGDKQYVSCHVAENYLRNNSEATPADPIANNGIVITGFMRLGSSVSWNDVEDSAYSGIWIQPLSGTWHARDNRGLLVQNNSVRRCQFGLHVLGQIQGVYTDPIRIEWNYIDAIGTRNGTTPAYPDQRWSRGMEFYAPAIDGAGTPPPESRMPAWIVVRWNYVSNVGLYDPSGTDGQGIGFDDNTRDMTCYGNVVVSCGGQGIQCFTTRRPRVFANVVANCASWTDFSGGANRPYEMAQFFSQLAMMDAVDGLWFANAAICGTAGNQRYALMCGTTSNRVHNNLAANAQIGITINPSASPVVDFNHYRSCATNKRQHSDRNTDTTTVALTANESFSTSSAGSDWLAQMASMSETLLMTIPTSGVTAAAPPATFVAVHGGAVSSPNTSFVDVAITLPDTVAVGNSLHLVGVVWSNTQATNRVTGLPTMTGETWSLGTKSDPIAQIEVYVWVVPQVQVAGANKSATVRITREDNSVWSFYMWQGPPLAASPVDMTLNGQASGTTVVLATGSQTTGPAYAVGVLAHNDFLGTNGLPTITGDASWTEVARRLSVTPGPSSLAAFRSLPANAPMQYTGVGVPAPPAWWHAGFVAYRLAGNVAPSITTDFTLPAGTVGAPYSATLAASGTTPITWSIASGALPAGLSLASATGIISGTPTAAGTASVTIRATNVASNATRTFSLSVAAALAAPSGVTVTPLSATSLRVAYADNSGAETGFEIRRKTAANGTVVETVTKAANATTHDFTGLSPATSYWFDVRAIGATNSAYSAEASGTTPALATLYAQLLTEPRDRQGADLNGSSGWRVAVWTAPSGGNLVGTLVGQYTGQAFEAALVSGQARMRVPLGAASGLVTAGQAIVVSISDGTRTTGIFSATVAT